MRILGICCLVAIFFGGGCGVKGDLIPYVDANPVNSSAKDMSPGLVKETEKTVKPKGKE